MGGLESWWGFLLVLQPGIVREGEGEVLGSAVGWRTLAMMPGECWEAVPGQLWLHGTAVFLGHRVVPELVGALTFVFLTSV